ncbi:MAG: hypothetical protein JWM78_3428 [Verrucomicrobiaceae bacterium]|nr:hypothetical protein [Verrucomicrobiaceae bacterium]
MARNRVRVKGRSEAGRYAGIPHAVMLHQDFIALPPNAIRLLLEMARQYNGHNNGDLSAAWTLMQKRGFNSEPTLNKALHKLLQLSFLVRTREGRFMNPGRLCALYALTWQAVDDCPGKNLEILPTSLPLRRFTAEIIKMPTVETEAIGFRNYSHKGKKHGEP